MNKEISEFYRSGIYKLNKFNNSKDKYNKKYLLEASNDFIQCLKIKDDFPEAYTCLAYIFFIMNDNDNAYKFICLAEGLAKKSHIIKQLKEKICTRRIKLK